MAARFLDSAGSEGGAQPRASGSTVSDYTALLSGDSWNGAGVSGRAAIISYSIERGPDRAVYQAAGLTTGFLNSFAAHDASEAAAVRRAIDIWGAQTGITFVEADSGRGDVRFGIYDFAQQPGQENSAGFAYYPNVVMNGTTGSGYQTAVGGDVFMDADFVNTASEVNLIGVLLHEIGHAIGLKHPFEGSPTLISSLDNKSQTVMSYTGNYPNFALGPLDVQAGSYLYGTAAADGTHLASWSWNAATDTLTQTGLAGADSMRGVGGFNVMNGGDGGDFLLGNEWSDTLNGGNGADRLLGAGGADRLTGGSGADTMDGGAGDDVFIVSGDDGVGDRIWGGDGADTLELPTGTARFDFIGGGFERVTGATPVLTILGTSGDDYVSFASVTVERPLVIDTGAGNDDVIGSSRDDTVRGGNGTEADFVDGQGGVDTLDLQQRMSAAEVDSFGSAGDLFLRQGATNNYSNYLAFENVIGTPFSDSIRGTGAGNRIEGGQGDDTLRGDGGADTIIGGAGADEMAGGDGFDILSYETTTAAMTVSLSGSVSIAGAPDSAGDLFSGFEGLRTGLGADAVTGSTGADWIEGWGGGDTLLGGIGADTLIGGAGRDQMTGGAGLDRMVLNSLSDSGTTFATRDVINTFAHGDKIDLSAIDARTNVAGDQAFSFIGAAAFSGVSGQLRFDMTNISVTGVKAYTVFGDVNGDRVADFSLQIYTSPTADRTGQPQSWNLASWDFIL
jgi:Ca2+-binding RTX toxin-like protein